MAKLVHELLITKELTNPTITLYKKEEVDYVVIRWWSITDEEVVITLTKDEVSKAYDLLFNH